MTPRAVATDGAVHDVVVVGAGGAGMTAALAAARQGLDTVLVEKSQWFGGSTARSGGGVWIPGNYALVDAGEADEPEQAKRYLDSIVGDVVPKVRRDTFIDRGPEVMDFIREQTPVRFSWVPEYSDYLPEQPGGRSRGRSVEPVPMDARFLGDELAHLHPPYTKAPANLIVTQADFRKISLGMRTLKGPLTMLRVLLTRLLSILRGRKMYAMGNALAIGLRQGLIDAGVPVEYGADLVDLLVEDGRVTGVTVVQDGVERTIRASRGVILGSGGFEKNLELRERYQPKPTSVDWTTGAESNTGGGHLAGMSAGAEVALMDDAWWGPTIPLPRGPWFALAERNLPGSIIVNSAGRRFMNEALPYVEAVHEIYKGEETGVPHVPAWMIVDQRYRNRYLFAGLSPRQPFPGRWYKFGTIKKAETLDALAAEIDVPAEGLRETVERFNVFARSGVDEDFHRGESAYDKYYSDPTVKPNPSLHSIDQGPFYAVKIVPGDLGTKGGLVTDERARVLRSDGTVIEGLYAAGNVSAAVMGRTYAGPGATIGPALVFGYLAAEDIANTHAAAEGAEASQTVRERPAETGAEPSEIPGGSEAEDGNLRRLGDPPSKPAPERRATTDAGLHEPEPEQDDDVTHTAPGAF
jgi:3-oxosteroid 1-dehydrogenase